MSNFNIVLAIMGAVVASAAGSAALAQSQEVRASQEQVMSFRATGDTLRFRVPTGGCTSAENFELAVQRIDGQAQLTLSRVIPDNCKGDFPEGTEIAFSYDAAGLDRADTVRLMNRVGP